MVLRPADDPVAVSGGPEALLSLADAGALGNRTVVLEADPENAEFASAYGIVSDTDRRRRTFGYMRDNESATMTEDQEFEQKRAVHDYRVFGEAGTVAEPGLTSRPAVRRPMWTPRGASPVARRPPPVSGRGPDTYWRPGGAQ